VNIVDVIKTKTEELLKKRLPEELGRMGYICEEGETFVYAKGEIPVLLVAHVDTVWEKPPKRVYFDPKERVLWAPDGLGADDRAGVWAILELLWRGYRPWVLFTDGEEKGGIGAYEVVEKIREVEVNFIVELDRQGAQDAVYYNCDCAQLRGYIEKFGFKKAQGSFSDISILCPAWGVAGVNLSVGYYNNHSREEHLKLNELEMCVERVARMLEDVPEEVFEYRDLYLWSCDVCGETCECTYVRECEMWLCEYCLEALQR